MVQEETQKGSLWSAWKGQRRYNTVSATHAVPLFFFIFFSSSVNNSRLLLCCLELMLLGFISLLLTVFQDPISGICISEKVAATWHPCSVPKTPKADSDRESDSETNSRKLLEFLDPIPRRVLATKGYDKCAEKAS